jgi:hypothetical protein
MAARIISTEQKGVEPAVVPTGITGPHTRRACGPVGPTRRGAAGIESRRSRGRDRSC